MIYSQLARCSILFGWIGNITLHKKHHKTSFSLYLFPLSLSSRCSFLKVVSSSWNIHEKNYSENNWAVGSLLFYTEERMLEGLWVRVEYEKMLGWDLVFKWKNCRITKAGMLPWVRSDKCEDCIMYLLANRKLNIKYIN